MDDMIYILMLFLLSFIEIPFFRATYPAFLFIIQSIDCFGYAASQSGLSLKILSILYIILVALASRRASFKPRTSFWLMTMANKLFLFIFVLLVYLVSTEYIYSGDQLMFSLSYVVDKSVDKSLFTIPKASHAWMSDVWTYYPRGGQHITNALNLVFDGNKGLNILYSSSILWLSQVLGHKRLIYLFPALLIPVFSLGIVSQGFDSLLGLYSFGLLLALRSNRITMAEIFIISVLAATIKQTSIVILFILLFSFFLCSLFMKRRILFARTLVSLLGMTFGLMIFWMWRNIELDKPILYPYSLISGFASIGVDLSNQLYLLFMDGDWFYYDQVYYNYNSGLFVTGIAAYAYILFKAAKRGTQHGFVYILRPSLVFPILTFIYFFVSISLLTGPRYLLAGGLVAITLHFTPYILSFKSVFGRRLIYSLLIAASLFATYSGLYVYSDYPLNEDYVKKNLYSNSDMANNGGLRIFDRSRFIQTSKASQEGVVINNMPFINNIIAKNLPLIISERQGLLSHGVWYPLIFSGVLKDSSNSVALNALNGREIIVQYNVMNTIISSERLFLISSGCDYIDQIDSTGANVILEVRNGGFKNLGSQKINHLDCKSSQYYLYVQDDIRPGISDLFRIKAKCCARKISIKEVHDKFGVLYPGPLKNYIRISDKDSIAYVDKNVFDDIAVDFRSRPLYDPFIVANDYNVSREAFGSWLYKDNIIQFHYLPKKFDLSIEILDYLPSGYAEKVMLKVCNKYYSAKAEGGMLIYGGVQNACSSNEISFFSKKPYVPADLGLSSDDRSLIVPASNMRIKKSLEGKVIN